MRDLRRHTQHLLIAVVILCTVGATYFLARNITRIEEALPLASLHKERDFAAFQHDLSRLEAELRLATAAPTPEHARRAAFALDLAILRLNDNRMLYGGQDNDIMAMQHNLQTVLQDIDTGLHRTPADYALLQARLDDLGQLLESFHIVSDTVFQASMDQASTQREHLAGLRDSMSLLIGLFGLGGISLVVLLLRQQKGIRLLEQQDRELRSRELRLRQNEALLLQSQRVAVIGHYLLDIAAGTWTNSITLDEMFGIDAAYRHDIEGWLSLVHPDDRDDLAAYLRDQVLGQRQPFDREYRIVRRRDKAVRWVHGLGQLESGPDGRPARMFGIIQDISDRKAAEEILRNREREFRMLAENSPDPIIRYDLACRRIYVSPALERFSGYPSSQLIGKSLAERPAVGMGAQAAADYEARIHKVLATGKPEEWESGWATDDGGSIHFLIRAVPELNESGEITSVLAVARDISERKRFEERQRLAASVFTSSQEGIVITDADNLILDVNEAFSRITGYRREDVLGRNPKLLRSGRQDPGFYSEMWRTLGTTGKWRGEVWNRRKSGELYAELLSIVAVQDEQGRIQNYVGVFSDISRLKEHEAELNRIAHYDPLTGAPNRRLFSDRLGQAIAHSRRSGRSLAICYLDLDGFKPINDRFGHEVGDQMLVVITRNLQGVLRAGDTLARLGGDEFVLLFTDLGRDLECFPILDRLLAAVAAPVSLAGTDISVSASIGVSIFPRDDADPDTLLRHADQAMYLAKAAGKNRYHLFDPEQA